jgi:DNA-binding NtrC family response regulator
MPPTPEVLLVDDDHAVVAVVTRILKKSGFRVTSANSLDKARAILSQHHFTILIYDLSIGAGRKLDEVMDELRAAQPRMPVLLITGYAGPDTESEVERLHIDLLEKPFEADELVERVTELIKRSKHSAA